MYFVFSKSGITKILVIAVITILVAATLIGAFVLFRLSPFSSPSSTSPTSTLTPTSTPTILPTPTSVAGQTQIPPSTTTSIPSLTPTPTTGFINVTGYALYELSQTEFVFNAGTQIYNVTMDLNTKAINLNGKLLGGYQIVSQLIPASSLQLTITGTVNGSTIYGTNHNNSNNQRQNNAK